MAWCLAARDTGKKPNLNNVSLGQIISIDVSGAISKTKNAFQKFTKACLRDEDVVDWKLVLKWRRKINQHNAKLWLRGKYELWFFEAVLLLLLQDLVKKRKSSKQRVPRIPSSLREHTLFDVLGGRMQKPETLDRFLNLRLATSPT
jgi:hypothetical protein